MGIGCYLRQKKLYKLQSVSEHISKISISHSSTAPPSPDPSLADSQWAQTEALGTGKRQASGKPKDNCLLHFGSENPILEAMGEASKHSLYTISKANIRSDYTCPSLPLQPHRLRHTVLEMCDSFGGQCQPWPQWAQVPSQSLSIVVKSKPFPWILFSETKPSPFMTLWICSNTFLMISASHKPTEHQIWQIYLHEL